MLPPLSPGKTLLMLSPLAVPDPSADPLGLPRKYMDGITALAEAWQGPLMVLLPKATKRDDTLDYISIPHAALPFELCPFPDSTETLRALIQSAALVVAPMVPRYVQIPGLCAFCHTPVVIEADFTPTVRKEIVLAETRNPVLLLRRLLWQRNMEQYYTAMVRAAEGIQLQGPAAFNFYAPLNPSPLMYFDTRVRRAMFATADQIQSRAERLRRGAPLRLVYAGRWRRMKGVLDLPRVAAELRRLGVRAEWNIFGAGALEEQLRRDIAAADLEDVRLRGEIPFPDLMRFAANECDLFVCCHLQGDPSTTFIETLSMGVPLVGYDTSGLAGIVSLSGAGWLTPRHKVAALAARIAELDRDREALITASRAAAEFTRTKSFQDMTQLRSTHFDTLAKTVAVA